MYRLYIERNAIQVDEFGRGLLARCSIRLHFITKILALYSVKQFVYRTARYTPLPFNVWLIN